jgi:electron transfer flavoprotein beta subunit
MNIVVCVKRTLDSETRVRLGPKGVSIDEHGARYVVGPYDEFALEAALRTRGGSGKGEVIVLSFGDEHAAAQLRACLAKGADRGVLLKGEPAADGLPTARALASAIEGEDAPLVLTGLRSVDDGRQQVGPMLATLLDRPCVTGVVDFEVVGDRVICRREAEAGVETWETDLPAVLSITRGTFGPRAPSFRDIAGATEKPLEERPSPSGTSRLRVESLQYVRARPVVRILGTGPEAVPELVDRLREEVGGVGRTGLGP